MPSEWAVRKFESSIFRPAETAWLKARSLPDDSQRFAALTLIEAYGWIRLGVQSDAFPREIALDLLRSASDSIREAYGLAARQSLLGEGLTRQSRGLLSSGELIEKSFQEAFKEFVNLVESANLFSLWCAEFKSFESSRFARALIEMLNFAREEEWRTALAELRDEPFAPAPKPDSKISLFEGYLRALQHIDRMADLMSIDDTPSETWPSRAIMRIEVGTIHRWQLNFESKIFEARFKQVTEAIEERLRREAKSEGAELAPGGLVAGVKELEERYRKSFEGLSFSESHA